MNDEPHTGPCSPRWAPWSAYLAPIPAVNYLGQVGAPVGTDQSGNTRPSPWSTSKG